METLNLLCCLLFIFEVTRSKLTHVLCIFSDQLYIADKFFLSTFSSLLTKDNRSMLFIQFLLRYSLNSTLINCYFKFLLEAGTAVIPYC